MIEIEKKFALTPLQKEALLYGARPLGQKVVEDDYFDTDDYSLTKHDFWFRKRDGAYELKVPLQSGSGSYGATNRYHELTDLADIARELKASTDNFEEALSLVGIKRFMTCFTDRTSYEKDGFHIDIDAASYRDTDFTHAVAEIELLIEDEAGADAADDKIMEFAKQFNLTTDQVVLGKVAAYLQAERPDHYEALIAAGVLK